MGNKADKLKTKRGTCEQYKIIVDKWKLQIIVYDNLEKNILVKVI